MDPGTVSMRVALCYDLLRFIPGSPYLFRSFRILRICSCKSRSCVCFENSFVLSIAKRAFVVSCCGYPSSEYWAREIWMHRSSNYLHRKTGYGVEIIHTILFPCWFFADGLIFMIGTSISMGMKDRRNIAFSSFIAGFWAVIFVLSREWSIKKK